jgi:hypothetical protein
MMARVQSAEHKRLVLKFKVLFLRKGASYAQIGLLIGMTGSGVHHLVNGTGGRLPDERTFETLVKALGGDPKAKTWRKAFDAARASYAKPKPVTSPRASTPQVRRRRRGRGATSCWVIVTLLLTLSGLATNWVLVRTRDGAPSPAARTVEPLIPEATSAGATTDTEAIEMPVKNAGAEVFGPDRTTVVDTLRVGQGITVRCVRKQSGLEWVQLVADAQPAEKFIRITDLRFPEPPSDDSYEWQALTSCYNDAR